MKIVNNGGGPRAAFLCRYRRLNAVAAAPICEQEIGQMRA